MFGQVKVTGQIKDTGNHPIAGVSIVIKGTRIGTMTDASGFFSLKLNDSIPTVNDSMKIRIATVGYTAKEVSVSFKDPSFISVTLNESGAALNEVVVTAVGVKNPKGFVSFPWPPPNPSAQTLLDQDYFSSSHNLKDVDNTLVHALKSLGYSDLAYYYVPDGFALVTKIEQMNDKGETLSEPARWSAHVKPLTKLSWSQYLRSLFFSTPGYFRIIVFVVTDKPFTSSGKRVGRETASQWLYYGLNVLPYEIGSRKLTDDYRCTALIYEYKKPESDDAILDLPGIISGDEHLERSKIINALKR